MKKLLIIGASARAAAQSAHRAGFEVIAADLFADQDLAQVAQCFRVKDYPADFLAIRRQFPFLPLVYTGALENHPALVEELQTIGPVWGQSADTLRKVRDPGQWTSALKKRNIATPKTTFSPPTNSPESWLAKPFRSAGGANIRRARSNAAPSDAPPDELIYQEVLHGEPCSGAFVAGRSVEGMRFLGASRMLVGKTWGASHEFGYCGSISYQPHAEEKSHWLEIGQALADAFRLDGVFGVDAIATENGLVPIEINPRYTASMETLEVSLHQPIMRYHAMAFLGENLDVSESTYQPCGKLFVYADRDLVVPESLEESLGANQILADIPTPGQSIPAGAPITTILHTGETAAEKLLDTADRLRNACISQHH